jgi:Leucine-rich repeat (LRR) protein
MSTVSDLSQLKYFPKLEELNLASSNIDTLDNFPPMPYLRILDLSGNHLSKIASLGAVKNLESLDLSGDANNIIDYRPLLKMKKLRVLKIGKITPHGLDVLQHTLPNVTITANAVEVGAAE